MQFSFSILDPKTYTSPSGEYALIVDPQSREGSGAARYHLRRRGTVVWQGVRPFALWEAGVTDAGVVGGYAYSAGRDGWGSRKSGDNRDYGDFETIILDAHGRERLRRKIKRVPSRFEHQPPQPLGAGMFLDGMGEHLVVRVEDPDMNRQAEEWWVFSLSTGRAVRRYKPNVGADLPQTARSPTAARPVSGTPLVLLHLWRFDEKPASKGARFALLDLNQPSTKPVWTMDLPHDYSIPGNGDAELALEDEIGKNGAILAATTPRRFTLRAVARKQRVTFQTIAEPGGRWRVTPTDVSRYVPPALPEGPRVPEVRLTLRDRLDLLASDKALSPAPNPVRRPSGLVAAGADQLAFFRLEELTLILMTAQGKVTHEVALNHFVRSQPTNYLPRLKLLWQSGTRFLVFCERLPDKPIESYTEACRVDAATGLIQPLTGFRCPPLKAVAAFPDETGGAARGGFVALTTTYESYTTEEAVCAYDGNGRQTWTLPLDSSGDSDGKPGMLFAPESLTVLRDGSVAVLDNIRQSVQFFDRSGRYVWTLSLPVAWKRRPSYPSDIVADPHGGFLIHDFQGTTQLVWMNGDGSVRRGFTPCYPDGQPMDNPDFCVAADGRLWTNDRYSLMGLDAEGRATTRLGEAPDAHRLGTIAKIALQTDGSNGDRILVVDDRTLAVHVLDAKGRRLHVCVPRRGVAEASTRSDDWSDTPFSLGPHDSFALNDDWFASDGKPCAKPTGCHPARERAGKLSRRANGDWLGARRTSVEAPDGSLAVLDEPLQMGIEGPKYVSLYSAADIPERTINVPRSLGALVDMAYDGKHIVLVGSGWAYGYRAATGHLLWRFALPRAQDRSGKTDAPYYAIFLADAGRTLCLFDGERLLYRFAMLSTT